MNGGTFAAVFVALWAAHAVADTWIQTETQAATKGLTGPDSWRGRGAAARHVGTYTLVALAALVLAWSRLGLDLAPVHVIEGLALSAVTHWWADRRWTLAMLARWSGHRGFMELGGPLGGAYLLDQAWHVAALFVAALVIV
jgi:hypothetical protein